MHARHRAKRQDGTSEIDIRFDGVACLGKGRGRAREAAERQLAAEEAGESSYATDVLDPAERCRNLIDLIRQSRPRGTSFVV